MEEVSRTASVVLFLYKIFTGSEAWIGKDTVKSSFGKISVGKYGSCCVTGGILDRKQLLNDGRLQQRKQYE